nr:hypothetical protein [Chloroflexota bacterium]
MLQYETKLNILRQTIEQLRTNYKEQYKHFKKAYEKNPSDKMNVYKQAILLKDIVEEYYQSTKMYIIHEQILHKFWDNAKDPKEKEYGKTMLKLTGQNVNGLSNAQKTAAKIEARKEQLYDY